MTRADPTQFGRQIVEYLRQLMLVQVGGARLVEAAEETREALHAMAARVPRGALVRAVRAFNTAVGELKGGWQPQLPLELAVIESVRPYAEAEPAARPAPSMAASSGGAPARSVPLPRPEPVAAPRTAPQFASSALPTIRFSELQARWNEVLLRLKDQNKIVYAAMPYTTLRALDSGTLDLAVKDTFRAKFTTEEWRKTLADAIEFVTGARLEIRVIGEHMSPTGAVDDKIMNDPLINQELKSGGKVRRADG